MGSSRLSRYRAERLLRKDFTGLRSKVLAVVRSQLLGKGVALDPSDLEACYAQAWQGLYTTVLEGDVVESPSAWLVLVTFRRAIDEHRSASRNRPGADADALALAEQADGCRPVTSVGSAFVPDFAAELDNRDRLRRVFEGMRWGLSERECEAASLCYLQGLSRADAAGRMEISQARMRKLMEGSGPGRPGVSGKVGELLDTIKTGGWCEQQSSLLRAFAFGVLDPEGERHALAVAHCRECPACRTYVASLRGLASVLPLPLLPPLAPTGGTARAGTGGRTRAGAGERTKAGTRERARVRPGERARAGIGARARVRPGARARAGTGGRAGSTGWSGLTGSLTVKLAVTAAAMLGAGYALLSSRAHGSIGPSAHAIVSSPAARGTLARTPLQPLGVPPRKARLSGGSPPARVRSSRATLRRHASRGAITGEFGPERVPRERAVVPLTSQPVLTRSQASSHATGEFGIE
jgi:DNA-directed RNA polymerase specialized sigma24 family protein